MMAALKENTWRGVMKYDEPMARHTTWRVGGKADRFYTPADVNDLAEMLSTLPADEPVFWLGLGSNLLVRDGGIRGTVIALKGSLSDMELLETNRIKAGAGVSCAKLARYCSKHDLVGGEFFAGIPGLLGGALAMNAGAFGGETWRHVVTVSTIDRSGNIHLHTPNDYEIGYRTVNGPAGEWFIEAILQFEHGDGRQAATAVRKLLDRRAETQPIGLPSCGSVFRNPEGDFAARLIEASGLKGVRIGGAEVSPKHANFIINVDNATAQDIEDLVYYVQQQVRLKQGVELRTEVKMVGERCA